MNQKKYQKYDDLVSPWKKEAIREVLIERLRNDSNNNLGSSNRFTEESIVEEYYRYWLEFPSSSHVARLAHHPLLNTSDEAQLNKHLEDEKNNQLKYSSGIATGTLVFYTLFLSRLPFFQNFFNNRYKNRFLNFGKKVIGCYAIFIANVATLNNHYEKKIPEGINQKGLFKKYGIIYDKK